MIRERLTRFARSPITPPFLQCNVGGEGGSGGSGSNVVGNVGGEGGKEQRVVGEVLVVGVTGDIKIVS